MANNTWGIHPWSQGEWGQQTTDVVVEVGLAQGWGRVTWGQGAWNESVPIDSLSLNSGTISIVGKAEVALIGNNLQVQTGTITFAGKATVEVTGNNLTLTIGDAIVTAKSNVDATTNLLNLLVQSPNIFAGGSVTDAVVGEELGLVGTLIVLALIGTIAYVALTLARKTNDLFTKLIATSVMAWIVVQSIINVGAVLGLLPVTGVPLPLVSYGGSSLVFTMSAIGVLMAVLRAEPNVKAELKKKKSLRAVK